MLNTCRELYYIQVLDGIILHRWTLKITRLCIIFLSAGHSGSCNKTEQKTAVTTELGNISLHAKLYFLSSAELTVFL